MQLTLGRKARLGAAVAIALGLVWPVWAAWPVGTDAAAAKAGRVVGWGDDTYGQTEIPAAAQSGVIAVAAGCRHSVALESNGGIVAWGDDSRGQTDVPAAAKSGVIAVVAGCWHNVALKSNGTLIAWGDNSYGQATVPSLPSRTRWSNIAAGDRHTVGLYKTTTGTNVKLGRAWGDNSATQLNMPTDTNGAPLRNARDVEAGGDNSIVLENDGTVVVWGAGPESVLTIPTGLPKVTGVTMGSQHAVVITIGGQVAAWGENGAGQATVPQGLSNVTAVSADGDHSLALRSNGAVVAWGSNDSGESKVPPLPAGGRYVSIAAGLHHSLAVVIAPAAQPSATAVTSEPSPTAAAIPTAEPTATPTPSPAPTASPSPAAIPASRGGGDVPLAVAVLGCVLIGVLGLLAGYLLSVRSRRDRFAFEVLASAIPEASGSSPRPAPEASNGPASSAGADEGPPPDGTADAAPS